MSGRICPIRSPPISFAAPKHTLYHPVTRKEVGRSNSSRIITIIFSSSNNHEQDHHQYQQESSEHQQEVHSSITSRGKQHPPLNHHLPHQDPPYLPASTSATAAANAALHGSDERLLLQLLVGLLREVRVHRISGPASLVDRPHHQRLTSAAVTRRENAFRIGAVIPIRRVDVLALVGQKKKTGHKHAAEREGYGGGKEALLICCSP